MAIGGSGQSAGLIEGDVVIEVNGQNVEEKYLEDVMIVVREGGNFLSLLVMEKTSYNKMRQTDTPANDVTAEVKKTLHTTKSVNTFSTIKNITIFTILSHLHLSRKRKTLSYHLCEH